MAEGLKPIWTNIPVPTPDLSGDVATSRGTDPNIDTSGSHGLISVPWLADVTIGKMRPGTDIVDTEESNNSVSGLPSLPNRYEPAETPPEPPSLQDRSPSTIDEK